MIRDYEFDYGNRYSEKHRVQTAYPAVSAGAPYWEKRPVTFAYRISATPAPHPAQDSGVFFAAGIVFLNYLKTVGIENANVFRI